MKKFPDFVPPTKVAYLDRGPTLHLRRCMLQSVDDPTQEWEFDKEEVRIGSMDDNDVVISDDTVSRYHCRIAQEDTGYVLVDQRSTNGTFINKVRVREAFLKPGSIVSVGQSQLRFNAREEEVQIVPSRNTQCGGLIGGNARMREIYSIIEKIAPTATTVVIDGETGTGKEVVAQAIHSLSPRVKNDLVVFDCGAVPPNLIESELFGHEKGSFTGAVMTRQGLFEQADGGTLFLDELGELPLDLQPHMLRALETRHVRRVGGTHERPVDVRIIAATNRLEHLGTESSRIRIDLYHRLATVVLVLPPLRERMGDLVELVEACLEEHAPEHGIKTITEAGWRGLSTYSWPGNVRELRAAVSRACALGGSELGADDFFPDLRFGRMPIGVTPRGNLVPYQAIMRGAMEQALATHGTIRAAAAHLGMAKSTFAEKAKAWGLLPRPRPRNGQLSKAMESSRKRTEPDCEPTVEIEPGEG